jgi:rubrerythrin
MGKVIQPTRVLIPVEQAIAQIQEALECYEGRIATLKAELKILRDE